MIALLPSSAGAGGEIRGFDVVMRAGRAGPVATDKAVIPWKPECELPPDHLTISQQPGRPGSHGRFAHSGLRTPRANHPYELAALAT